VDGVRALGEARGEKGGVGVKEKTWKIKAEVELVILRVGSTEDVREDLINKCVKVKSGPYENRAIGRITKIIKVKRGSRHWEWG